MPTQTITIAMDTSDVSTAGQQLISALQGQSDAVESFYRKMAAANKEGEVTRQVFAGITSDGDKVEATLKKVANGWEVVSTKVQKAAEKIKEIKDAGALQAANARGLQGESLVTGAFNTQGLGLQQANTVEAAVQRIKSVLASGKVELTRFQELLAQFQSNPRGILPGLSSEEATIVRSFRSIQNAVEQAAAAKQRAADKAQSDADKIAGAAKKTGEAAESARSPFISLGGVLRLLEAQVLKRIFSTLEGEILQSVAAAQKFMLQVAEIRTVSQDAQLSTQQWSQGITELSNAFGKTREDVAEGTYQTLSNQVAKGADSFKFLESAARFSQAAVASMTDSVNLGSGALKSFQLPASDSERVFSILFKTIELGRVRAKDMADTFGRIGTVAAEAGLKIEEVGAAIAVLTNRGIKPSDSFTLLQNILLKLIRPTDEMKKLFDQWGVASGTAAIATFGFGGVLSKLDEEAKKGTGHLGDLLGQIRAIRGTIGLTAAGFKDYTDALNKNIKAQASYQTAQKEVAESPGQRAAQEVIKLRNFFQQDFGEPFIKGLLAINDAVGGATTVIKGMSVAIQVGASAFVVYKIAVATSSLEMVTWTGVLGASKAAAVGMTTTTLPALGAAFVAVAPYAAAFIAAFAAGSHILGTFDRDLSSFAERAKKITDDAANARKGTTDAEAKRVTETTDKLKSEYASRIQTVLQFSTRVLQESVRMKDVSAENLKATTEALKISTGSYFDSLRRVVAEFQREAGEARSAIKASLKESEDLPRRGQNKIFDEKFKFASGGQQDFMTGQIFNDQKIEMLKARILDVAAQARAEFAKGTKEGAEEGRKLFNDVQTLQSQLFEKRTENEKKVFEFRAKQDSAYARGVQAPAGFNNNRLEFVVKTKELETQLNDLTRERLTLEDKFRKGQEERIKQQEGLADKEKERIRALQQQFTLLEKIDLFDKEGKLKTEFKGPEGVEKARREFDERRAKILELSGQDADPARGFQVFLDLQKQRAAVIEQIRTAQRAEAVGQIQESGKQDLKAVDELATKVKERIAEGVSDIGRLLGGVDRQILLFKEAVEKPIQNRDALGSPSVDKPSEPARKEALEKIEELKAAREAFDAPSGRTVENALKLKLAIQDVNEATLEYIRIRGLGDPSQISFAGDSKRTVSDQTGVSGNIGNQIVEAARQIATGNAELDRAKNTITQTEQRLREIPGALQAMNDRALEIGPPVQATFQSLAESASRYAAELERINEALLNQPQLLPQLPNPDAENRMFGGGMDATRYYASGGYVGFVPRGSDQVPAMLGRDEFVMTGRATRAFKPILEAMNAGTSPRYMAQGGPVTNVGDITVNVSGGQTDEQSLRNIAQGLRRGIRRGSISLT